MSGTTRVSRYQKKHSLTHHPDHRPIFISFFHLPWSIASSMFKLYSFCTTSVHVLFGLPIGLEPSTSYCIHFSTQSLSSFRNTCPYHRIGSEMWIEKLFYSISQISWLVFSRVRMPTWWCQSMEDTLLVVLHTVDYVHCWFNPCCAPGGYCTELVPRVPAVHKSDFSRWRGGCVWVVWPRRRRWNADGRPGTFLPGDSLRPCCADGRGWRDRRLLRRISGVQNSG